MRTELQRDADSIDCDLYRLICRVEGLYTKAERLRDGAVMATLREALLSLRAARPDIRRLMSESDRAVTS